MRPAAALLPVLLALPTAACGGDGGGRTGFRPASGGGAGADAGGSAGTVSAGAGGSAGTAGTAGAAGAAGTAGSGGAGGSGGALCPNDTGAEPNDTEVLATPVCGALPCEMDECDKSGSTGNGGPYPPAAGVVGPGDMDFFTFHGNDTFALCTVNAAAETADSGFRLCMFAACPDGTDLRGCPQGTVDMSMVGFVGCCTTAPGKVELDHDCTGTVTDDDSANVYIRVDSAAACVPYAVEYHF